MAKTQDAAAQSRQIIEDVRRGIFAPVYLLMGDEPYYPEMVCDEIVANALDDSERDFNQTVCYGMDTDAASVGADARSYPMMAERRLVVVRDAQKLSRLEDLADYVADPMESTVLVLLMRGASADKRRSLYKNCVKKGIVLESVAKKDYEMPSWIMSYYSSLGLRIDPDAASLLAEYAGTDLGKIALETEKLRKNLPEGASAVGVADIEANVGVSREFSIFELTKALSGHDAARSMRLAAHIGQAPKFALPMAVSALYTHFYRILKYQALRMRNPSPSPSDKAAVLGVNPYFFREYDMAVTKYPVRKCMAIVSLLEEYDFKGKGGGAGEADPADLLTELVAKILS